MSETITVEVDGTEYEVTVTSDGEATAEETFNEPEVILVSKSNSEVWIGDIEEVEFMYHGCRHTYKALYPQQAVHPDSPREGSNVNNQNNKWFFNWFEEYSEE
jgi:hypothetical protein